MVLINRKHQMAGICGRIAWVVGRDLDYAYVLIHQYSLVHHVINQENHDRMTRVLDDLAHYSKDRLFLHPILEFEFFPTRRCVTPSCDRLFSRGVLTGDLLVP